ncbi:ABC transporter ATP-binding protein [Roseovarius sp. SCSIO 43702]|uniref:ABC transporter ATP-binding protein n=1 Tax=Roseovarius sp. SCSIO 43702 TaxID=2823043 RepID=UPI001C72C07F|nr:ABC transporter ATP-binding protein [Roseovarius sp. SCSIO 43702]QYX55706.1 ABC transporter ATP-binding protein [Roseovarius sp. SCSIO 43702]
MSLLTLERLGLTRGGRAVLRDVSFRVGEGELVGLVGPNGAGKTTLMRAALGLLGHEGQSSLAVLNARARARAVAWMPQAREIAWPVTVETVVTLGRLPHLPSGQRPRDADRAAVNDAMARMELNDLRDRPATELSGGEQARVLIARALAQDTPLLMADEPIAGLDPAHQIATMEIFAELAARGRSTLVSLHDLGLAVRHCTRLLLLNDGALVSDGPPGEVMTPERLAQVFGITAWYERTESGPVYQPLEVIR